MAIPDSNPSYNSSVDEGAGTDTAAVTTGAFLAANPDRQYVRVTNVDGAIDISFALGEAAVDQKGIVLGTLETWTMSGGAIWTGAINFISASGTPNVGFVEY